MMSNFTTWARLTKLCSSKTNFVVLLLTFTMVWRTPRNSTQTVLLQGVCREIFVEPPLWDLNTSTSSHSGVILPRSSLLEDSATVNPASPINICYSAFLLSISEEGDQSSLAIWVSPLPSTEYPTRPTDTPLYASPCSQEPYPRDGATTRIHASCGSIGHTSWCP